LRRLLPYEIRYRHEVRIAELGRSAVSRSRPLILNSTTDWWSNRARGTSRGGASFPCEQHVDGKSVVHIFSVPVSASGVRVDVDVSRFVLAPERRPITRQRLRVTRSARGKRFAIGSNEPPCAIVEPLDAHAALMHLPVMEVAQ
jgi:hypothetical protein